MSMKTANPFAYEVVRVREGGALVYQANLRCAKCGSRAHRRLNASLPPERVAIPFRRDGWQLDPTKPHSVRCPVCQEAAREKAAGEKPQKESTMQTTNVAPMIAPPRKLTPEEKMRVRNLLDAQFDEARGAYLDGYSDQRIGTEAQVPWANVREIREFAYGALKSVPELDALINDNRTLLERVGEVKKTAALLEGQSAALSKRIGDLAAKLGVAA